MANNQEFFCNHCKKATLFFLESDLLWYCDECGHVLYSKPSRHRKSMWDTWDIEDDMAGQYDFEEEGSSGLEDDLEEDDDEMEYDIEDEDLIFCPHCNNLIDKETLVDGYLCPICFEELSDDEDYFGEDEEEWL